MVLDATLLNTQHYKVKWSNPGKGIAPFPISWWSSYRKGSLRVTIVYGNHIYYFEMCRKSAKNVSSKKLMETLLGIFFEWIGFTKLTKYLGIHFFLIYWQRNGIFKYKILKIGKVNHGVICTLSFNILIRIILTFSMIRHLEGNVIT